jgi:hypothetical protein
MNLRFVTSLYNKHDNLPLSSLIFILTIVFLFLQHLKIDAILSIDLRHLQPLEHPCANSYNPHAPSIRNNPRTIYLTVALGGPSGPTVPNWVKFCRLLDVNKGNKVWQSD